MPGVGAHGKGEVGVAVVGVDVQAVLHQAVVVQAAEHAVGGDEVPGLSVLAQDVALHLAEAGGALGHKADVIQLLVGVNPVAVGSAGHVDLLPAGVGLVPEHRAPGLV